MEEDFTWVGSFASRTEYESYPVRTETINHDLLAVSTPPSTHRLQVSNHGRTAHPSASRGVEYNAHDAEEDIESLDERAMHPGDVPSHQRHVEQLDARKSAKGRLCCF